jgi:hypothetical protein
MERGWHTYSSAAFRKFLHHGKIAIGYRRIIQQAHRVFRQEIC